MSRVQDIDTRSANLIVTFHVESAAAITGRLLLAMLFVLSGWSKVMDPAGTIHEINAVGLPLPQLGLVSAICVELGGSAALIVGYKTRLAAALVAGFSFATAVLFHNHWADPDQYLHFFKDVAIAGGLLQVFAFGPGLWSFDARRRAARAQS